MARRSKSDPAEIPADAPRDTFEFLGNEESLFRVSRAIRAGRLPHAWLIGGPPGVGKATLAYRIARYLLAYGATDRGPEDLLVAPNDPTSIRIRAGAHPGLLVLRKGLNPETGRPMSVLSVDEVRKLGNLFGLTSGAGGWRIAIIDTADDMNDAAANALLKILEEPPARALLLVLAHSPSRLLPTIRSRCQRLDLKPLPDSIVDAELATKFPHLTASERMSVVKLAQGSIGVALKLSTGDGVGLAADIDRLIDNASKPDAVATLALADKVARLDDGVEAFGNYLAQRLSARIRRSARESKRELGPWVELCERIEASFRRTDTLHLEPRQTILSAARALSRAARHGTI